MEQLLVYTKDLEYSIYESPVSVAACSVPGTGFTTTACRNRLHFEKQNIGF
jgi:hypothetical protein